jgi:hypothetical protein
MRVTISQLSLGERDNYINQINQQIAAKRNMLLEKQKILKEKTAHNQFLKGVQNDYMTYYKFIHKQKQDQMNAMNTISQYLDDLIVNGKLTEEDLEETRKDQEEILNTIGNIKNDLNKIILE